jgi:hypothetical protein
MARTRHSIAATRITLALGVIVFAMAAPAWAQIDISGNWISSEENLRPRGNAGIGDYTGLPLNDAGRLRADTWDASILSQRERQTEPHGVQYYQFRSPARIEKVLDPATRQLVAYTLCCEIGALERVVWLDGRPHPPAYAERTWEGFSTGRWVGNTLTVTTTHLRTSFLERNGAPASHKSTVVEHFMRHGDQLTVVQFVVDPAYLEMPLIRSMDFVLDPRVTPRARQSQFEIVDEILGRDRGYVPSYPPGARHADWARFVGLPWEASRGGKATLFPEFLPTLRTMVREYQARAARAAGESLAR